MGIVYINTVEAAQIGQAPRRVKLITTDSLSTIITSGYLNNASLQGFTIYNTDVVDVIYNFNTLTKSGSFIECTASVSNGNITLTQATQVYSPKLQAIVDAVWSADQLLYLTGSDTVDVNDFTAYMQQFLTKGSALEALAKLGIVFGLTDVWAGGGNSHLFTATGILASDAVVAVMKTNQNGTITINNVQAGSGTISVGFTGDPGTNTQLYYIGIHTT